MKEIICISDTHGRHKELNLPDGDILIHSGDFSRGRGSLKEVEDFNDWLGILDFEWIITIAGNHDFPLEKMPEKAEALLTNCIYLRDSEIVIDGIKFYGSPYQPWFHSWAFNLQRGQALADKWALIPDDTDVLITHGPPYGILDLTHWDQISVGCKDLASRVIKVAPKAHIFGHIHEGYGRLNFSGIEFINASICNPNYKLNEPIVFEI